MLALIPAVALAVFAPVASALTITEPNSGGWTGNSTVQVAWDWTNDDPTTFSIELGNPQIAYGILAQGPIAIANNIPTQDSSIQFELPAVPAGTEYWLAFVAIDDVNNVYANTSYFPIRENLHSSSVPLSTVTTSSGGKGSSTKVSASVTKNSTSTATTGTTSAVTTAVTTTTTSTDSSFTSLVISTTSTTAPTSSTGAASRVEAAWYVSFAAAALGAIFA